MLSRDYRFGRVFLFDREMKPIGELSEEAGNLTKCVRVEEINGEHSLSITTTRHLEIGTRAITWVKRRMKRGDDLNHDISDALEWVVDEANESHSEGEYGGGDYHLCWSIQSDLRGIYHDTVQPGMTRPVTAFEAARYVMSGTDLWGLTVGADTGGMRPIKSAAIMPSDLSAWEKVGLLAKYWGIEIDVNIDGSYLEPQLITRSLWLKTHLGSDTVISRLEYGLDLTSVTRTPESGPYFCRVIPLGSGEQELANDGVTVYDEKLTIESENGGVKYLRDPEAEKAFRIRTPKGTYEYPTTTVSYSTDDPEELIALAREDLHAHTRPSVSYEGTIRAFRKIGLSTDYVDLGDEVEVIDHKFNKDYPLRISARVIRIEVDELGHEDTKLTIGKFAPTIEKTMASVMETVGTTAVSSRHAALEIPMDSSVPELPVYTIETPKSSGVKYTRPSYSMPELDMAVEEYGKRVAAIDGGAYYGSEPYYGGGGYSYDGYNGSAYDGGGSGGSYYGGDGWVHQIDGVTQETGTIDFRTVSSSSSNTSSETPPQEVVDDAQNVLWGAAAGLAGVVGGAGLAASVVEAGKRAGAWGSGE